MVTVDSYGPAIEADFHDLYKIDLLDFFRDVLPWGKFWRLLDQLGTDSRYIKALQNDEELAEQLAAEEDDEPWRPQAADWTLLHELAAEQRDILADIMVILGRGLPSNGKRNFPDSFPRPITELDKARERHQAARDEAEDEKLLAFVDQAKARWRAEQTRLQQEVSDALGVEREQ